MRGLVVVAVLLLVSVAITTLLYIAKDTKPSVGDDSTVYTPARSADETPPADKPLTDEELDKLIEKGLLTEDERRELKHLQNELNSTK